MDKTKLSEALKYSINQEEKLRVYLEYGRIEISNNRAENAIRPFCVGRRYVLNLFMVLLTYLIYYYSYKGT